MKRSIRRIAASFAAALCAAASAQPLDPAPETREAERLAAELMSGTAKVGAPFTLTDTAGHRRRLADFRGKVVVLYFGFTFCPDVCPVDLLQVGRALRSLGPRAKEVQPLFVTLDPARDTPRLLRRYVRSFHPSILALTGTEPVVRQVARDFKVYSQRVPAASGGYTIAHTAFIFILDREGRFREAVPPGTPAGRIAAVIEDALDSRP